MENEIQSCRPTGNPNKKQAGIGMPQSIYLHEFGELLCHAFDDAGVYQVGSSLTSPTWRDVDVRVMLDDETYDKMGFGDPANPQHNAKWCAYVMAFSELGRKMTGLPIDFQIQQASRANQEHDKERNALILGWFRRHDRHEAV